MSTENSRVMRTLLEITEYDFVIRYKEGELNVVADALSRSDHRVETEQVETKVTPTGFEVLEKIEGGGDSLFRAIICGVEKSSEVELGKEIPLEHKQLRESVVQHLIDNPKRFNIEIDKDKKLYLKMLKTIGFLPNEEVKMSFVDLYEVELWIFHGIPNPVVYKKDEKKNYPRIYLQCLANVHYNPLIKLDAPERKSDQIDEKYVNVTIPDIEEQTQVNVVSDHKLSCNHRKIPYPGCIVNFKDIESCALLDTGAQISAINETTYEKLSWNEKVTMIEEVEKLSGVAVGAKTNMIGITKLPLEIEDHNFEAFPFAIVKDDVIPDFCMILGGNFLKKENIEIDLDRENVWINDEILTRIKGEVHDESTSLHIIGDNLLGEAPEVHNTSNSEIWNSVDDPREDEPPEPEESEKEEQIRLVISDEQIMELQENNHAIRNLKRLVKNNVEISRWMKCLNQFKKQRTNYRVIEDILVVRRDGSSIPVVPFPFLVEVTTLMHRKLSHAGCHKLLNTMKRYFYHPYMETLTMNIGELLCLLFFFLNLKKYKIPLEEGKTAHKFYIFLIPGLCDASLSVMQYMALNFISGSTYRILIGASIVTTLLFSRILLKIKIEKRHIVGCGLGVIGLVIVGCSGLLESSSE